MRVGWMPVALSALCVSPAAAAPPLPQPTGPWAVGTTTFDWADERDEPATEDPDDHRTVVIQMWYPTDSPSGELTAYMPRLDAYRQTSDEATIEMLRGVETNAWWKAPIADGPFPVVVFSHGWSGSRSWYSIILEHVASHGYVVVGVDHPYLGEVALPDGSITVPDDGHFSSSLEAFEHYGSDVIFALDQLAALEPPWAGRLDLERVATVGHSSGGATAAEAAARDPRIKAFASLDSGAQKTAAESGLPKPVMLFRAQSGSYTGVFERDPQTHPKGTIYPKSFFLGRGDPFYEVVVANTTHGSFGDGGMLFAETEAERQEELTKRRTVVEYLVAFLDEHLREEPRDRLEPHEKENARLIVHSGYLPFSMPVPEGWRTETIPFPLAFAPDLPYMGLEELRFSGGMFDAESEEFWTYAFVWWVTPDGPRDVASLSTHLSEYFRGLSEVVAESRGFEVGEVAFRTSLEAGEGKTFSGAADTFDPFVTREPLRLHVRGDLWECPEADRHVVFFALSPQPAGHSVWRRLDSIREDFRCGEP